MTNKTLFITLAFLIGISSSKADDLEPILEYESCIDIATKEKLRNSEIIKSDENRVWVTRGKKYLLMYSCKNNQIKDYSLALFSNEENETLEFYNKYKDIFSAKYGEPESLNGIDDLIFWEVDIGIIKLSLTQSGSGNWLTGYTVYLNWGHNQQRNTDFGADAPSPVR